ncbi:unnamed protein product [Lymnaea stagnalis]|uniref:C2H2-type domain-containing protein n=1 Tax=Lymnaea stagnalis TaxID=6523 RepID=A0AAV2HFG0_LYMST
MSQVSEVAVNKETVFITDIKAEPLDSDETCSCQENTFTNQPEEDVKPVLCTNQTRTSLNGPESTYPLSKQESCSAECSLNHSENVKPFLIDFDSASYPYPVQLLSTQEALARDILPSKFFEQSFSQVSGGITTKDLSAENSFYSEDMKDIPLLSEDSQSSIFENGKLFRNLKTKHKFIMCAGRKMRIKLKKSKWLTDDEALGAYARLYICDICNKSFSHKYYITRHVKTHAIEKLFKCELCGKCFTFKAYLKRHNCKTSNTCDVCGTYFSSKSDMIIHRKLHFEQKIYTCEYCGKSSPRKRDMMVHKRIHTGEKPYCCSYCLRYFTRKSDLDMHSAIHTGKKPHECKVCGQRYARKTHLNDHMLKHSGVRPYKCETCSKSFRTKIRLSSHLRCHTGEKPFKCDVCEKAFAHQGSVYKHRKQHTGEKPYTCEYCHKHFRSRSDMTLHERTHTGEKPYQCEICAKPFAQLSSLRRHMGIHKKENLSEAKADS